jgi:hypothetical protein
MLKNFGFEVLYMWNFNRTAHFTLLLIREGATEKVLLFVIPLNSIYNKMFGFIELKRVFNIP